MVTPATAATAAASIGSAGGGAGSGGRLDDDDDDGPPGTNPLCGNTTLKSSGNILTNGTYASGSQAAVRFAVIASAVPAIVGATIAAEFASLRTGAAGALSERTELEPTAFPAYAVDGGPVSILVGCESMASLYPRLPRRRTHPLQCLVWCFSLHLHALQQ